MSVLVPTVLVTILVTAVDTLVAYDVADDLADHRHQWAEILCSLIDSLVEASGSFVSFAEVWDTDSRNEPADVSLSGAMTDSTNLVIPVAGCPLRHLVEDGAWENSQLADQDAVWKTGAIDVHPGTFLYPYFGVLDTAARYVSPYSKTASYNQQELCHAPMWSPSVHGVSVLPFDTKSATATSSFAGSGTFPDARAVVVPVVQPLWDHPDDDPLLELQGVWRFSIVYVNIQKRTILYLGPAQHDQGYVRAVQVR